MNKLFNFIGKCVFYNFVYHSFDYAVNRSIEIIDEKLEEKDTNQKKQKSKINYSRPYSRTEIGFK